jgi:hypothetical protein
LSDPGEVDVMFGIVGYTGSLVELERRMHRLFQEEGWDVEIFSMSGTPVTRRERLRAHGIGDRPEADFDIATNRPLAPPE